MTLTQDAVAPYSPQLCEELGVCTKVSHHCLTQLNRMIVVGTDVSSKVRWKWEHVPCWNEFGNEAQVFLILWWVQTLEFCFFCWFIYLPFYVEIFITFKLFQKLSISLSDVTSTPFYLIIYTKSVRFGINNQMFSPHHHFNK